LSYFSSGSFRGAAYVGASCPEAVASEARKARQIKRFVAEAVDDLIRWSVVESVATFAKPTAGQGSVKPSKRSAMLDLQSRIAAQARFL
jgi:hypothetical protein